MDEFRRAWEERFDRLDAHLRRLRERLEYQPPSKNGRPPQKPKPGKE